MDTDQIPTDPTIDPAPPSVTSLTPGPSQAPTSPAAGRGRRTGLIGLVVGIALVAVFSAGIGVGQLFSSFSGGAIGQTSNPASSPGQTTFGLIQEAWDTIHREYVGKDTLDDKALIYGAIKGLTEAVGDTGHTDFMTPQELAARENSLSGSYVGIGVRIDATTRTAPDALPKIVEVFKDSPAEKAGVKVNDVMVKVDEHDTKGQSLDDVASWVRGAAGTKVTLVVKASGTGPERTLEITRADVPIDPVSWAMVPGSATALLRLEQFSAGSADDVVKALKDAEAAGAQRIVLDLRGNPGGYVNEAVGVASQFLKSGLVYIERNAQGGETKHEVSPGGVATDLPLVVLVDKNTASSSEIVSGALQDAGRAEIVGETTYGTGTVLGTFKLSDGSALRVGTVEWLTPDGRRIWHEGIAPDVAVKLPDGAAPLSPDALKDLTKSSLQDAKDAQLLKALQVIGNQVVATHG